MKPDNPHIVGNPHCLDIPWKTCLRHPNARIKYRGVVCPLCKVEEQIFMLTYRDDMNRGGQYF